MISPCLGDGFAATPLAALDDEEGSRVADDLPPVIDAHVHLFPDRLFRAIHEWFRTHLWPVRYELTALQTMEFLLSRGVDRFVALQYAHKPGIARSLNQFMADLVRGEPRVLGFATVHPEDEAPARLLEEAFADGLAGVKLHCHVQCMPADAPSLTPIYELCQEAGRPVVIHAGREPKSPAYAIDTHAICSADRLERVLIDFPRLELVVPHLGMDELSAYASLIRRYDNLWLDTTMTLGDYFPSEDPAPMLSVRPDRIMYGTDFPNLPYAWDRELRRIAGLGLPPEALERILHGNAASLFFRS